MINSTMSKEIKKDQVMDEIKFKLFHQILQT